MDKQALSSTETLAVLREHKPMLAERFGVVELALFGSTVRDEAGPDSDVDILVSLDDRPGWTRFFDVQRYLEEALGRPVDLVVERALRAELRPLIEAEAIRV
ncbi:MAG: nucleotidyltransferase family protein [Chloroflexi bacterium]|nr:nucleotidyltransferase family protein [Chloroflexota bacterium]MYE32867.1 nucleotidyltransferase family protein [Chloroflexota bacterium]